MKYGQKLISSQSKYVITRHLNGIKTAGYVSCLNIITHHFNPLNAALFGRLDMIYFIYFAPTLILFLVWYWSRFNEKSYKIILCSWAGILCLIVVTIGTTSREADWEITKLGLALLVSSPIWFIGPLLAFADKTKWGFYSFVFVALVIPFISIIACFIILAYFHQIWGL